MRQNPSPPGSVPRVLAGGAPERAIWAGERGMGQTVGESPSMTWYEPAASKRFLAFLGSVWIAFLGVFAALANTPVRQLGLGITGALLVALWIRCARLAIGADAGTCVVRNVLRTHRLSNNTIADIRSGSPWWFAIATKGSGTGTFLYLDVVGRRRGLWVSAGLLDTEGPSDPVRATIVARILGADARVDRPARHWQREWDELFGRRPE